MREKEPAVWIEVHDATNGGCVAWIISETGRHGRGYGPTLEDAAADASRPLVGPVPVRDLRETEKAAS